MIRIIFFGLFKVSKVIVNSGRCYNLEYLVRFLEIHGDHPKLFLPESYGLQNETN